MTVQIQNTAHEVAMEGVDYVCHVGSKVRKLDKMSEDELLAFRDELVGRAASLAIKIDILIKSRTEIS